MPPHRRAARTVLAAAGAAFTIAARAAAPEDAEAPAPPLFQPGAWLVGDVAITPQMGVAAGFNDNLRLQSSSRLQSPFVAVMPGIAASRVRGEDSLQLGWRSEWTRFTASREDDTLNSELSAAGLEVLGTHTALTWSLVGQDWHDALGLAGAADVAQSPDHFRALALGTVLRHDSDDQASRRVEIEPTLSIKRYTNHREITTEADADTASLVGRLLWLAAPARRIGPELRVIRTRYPNGDEHLSNVDLRGLGTLKWDAGGDVWGSASVGVQRRRFDTLRHGYTGLAWEADWQWQASPRTQWSFATSRGAGEAPGEGVDEAVGRRASLGVAQDWSDRWHGGITASTSVNHYVGSPLSRDDRVQAVDFVLRADLARNWRLSVNLGWMKRRSEIEAFNFERQLGSIELSAAL